MSRKMIITSICFGIILLCKILQAYQPDFDADGTIQYMLSLAGGWGILHTVSDVKFMYKK